MSKEKRVIICEWCSLAIKYTSDTKEGISAAMKLHSLVCTKNPLVVQLAAQSEEIGRLRALCFRESQVLQAALKRKNGRSMIAVAANSLAEQSLPKQKEQK